MIRETTRSRAKMRRSHTRAPNVASTLRQYAGALAVSAAAAIALWAWSVSTAAAQATPTNNPASSAPAVDVPLEEYRRLLDGRTAYFYLANGALWGREYYIPGTDRSVFRYPDGRCFEGEWRVEGGLYCFYYRERPSCWRTVWLGGRLTVFSQAGGVQFIDHIADGEPLSCGSDLIG